MNQVLVIVHLELHAGYRWGKNPVLIESNKRFWDRMEKMVEKGKVEESKKM